MSEEPRRSGRANKGQHKNASSSPAPDSKPTKGNSKPTKGAASKRSRESATSQTASDVEDDDDEEVIRCICGNEDAKDKRAFIGCDSCSAWQHNVCMGMPDDDEEVGEHYFCEQCRPEEHQETLEALEKGEKIWDTRNKIWQNEKKMSKIRKGKGKDGVERKPGWLRRELLGDADTKSESVAESQETSNKRKRDVKEEDEAQSPAPTQQEVKVEAVEKPVKAPRQEKRRKSVAPDNKEPSDPDTAIVPIENLPQDRQKIAQVLSKIIADDIQERTKARAYRISDGETAKSLGERLALRVEYSMSMNHGGSHSPAYGTQFRALNANLKRNKALVQHLLDGSLTPDELSIMPSADMASEESQKQRAALKAEVERQSTIDQREDGPRYRRTHKGDELVENDSTLSSSAPVSRPVRHSIDADMLDSPTAKSPITAGVPPLSVDTKRPSDAATDRRTSNSNFDVNNIWAKTAQSPTQAAGHRPSLSSTHRQSSLQIDTQESGAKEDADVDRMLADNEESYSPADYTGSDGVVWRGKLIQSTGEIEPTVNARFVAGRDVSATIPWREILPEKLVIDGRLQIAKAEEYLCGLQWSSSSDVSVLALTAYDDSVPFNTVFDYFKSRERYAVVKDGKPALVKDLYIIPIEVGAKLPEHVGMLEHCTIKLPVEERLLLATFVVARQLEDQTSKQQHRLAPGQAQQQADNKAQPTNGHLPHHMRQGPAGSPMQGSGPGFSPVAHNGTAQYPGAPVSAYGGAASPFPPNPYSGPEAYLQQNAYAGGMLPQGQIVNPLALEILGPLVDCSTAREILAADPQIRREMLQNLREILERDPNARTDITVLAAQLDTL